MPLLTLFAAALLLWLLLGWLPRLRLVVFGLLSLLVLINTFDESLEPGAAAALQPPPRIPDAGNAYIGLLGLPVAGEPLLAAGAEVQRKFDAWGKTPPGTTRPEPYAGKTELKLELGQEPGICAKLEDCRWFAVAPPAAASLRAKALANDELLARHREWLAMPAYQPHVMNRTDAWLPAFQLPLNLQKLRLALAVVDAHEGRTQQALTTFGEQLAFYRRMLAGSDLLIDKMVASAAVRTVLPALAELLREQTLTPVQLAEVLAMLQPLSPAERGLTKAYDGEFRYGEGLMREMVQQPDKLAALNTGDADTPTYKRWGTAALGRLMLHFYQHKATANLRYREFEQLKRIDAMPCAQQPQESTEKATNWPLKNYLHNPVGYLLTQLGSGNYSQYGERQCDLEGLNRLVALQARLLAEQVPKAQVAQWLQGQGAEGLSPYDGPLNWNATASTLGFEARDERLDGVLPLPIKTFP